MSNFIETNLPGVLVFEPKVFKDDRGYFFESFNHKLWENKIPNVNFVQDNESFSRKGTVRGIHLQMNEYAQAKLVRCIEGTILDVAVDLRKDSESFGKHFSVILSEENKKQLYIPRGFGHGFSVLSNTARFQYKCDNFYNKDSESGVLYNDRDLGIDWKLDQNEIILSKKDKELFTLKEF